MGQAIGKSEFELARSVAKVLPDDSLEGSINDVGVRILVADDDDLLAELLEFRLEDAGYEVRVVTDGEAALDACRSGDFSLVVLDAMMPVKTGFEVLRLVRETMGVKAPPIVMLTSRNGEDDIVQALRQGATDYMTKPFIPQELVARIGSILAARGSNATSPEN